MPDVGQLINLGGWGFCAVVVVYVGRWVVRRIVDPLMDMLQSYFSGTAESMKRIAGATEEHRDKIDHLSQKIDDLHSDVKRALPIAESKPSHS